jgi:hypothetical protein
VQKRWGECAAETRSTGRGLSRDYNFSQNSLGYADCAKTRTHLEKASSPRTVGPIGDLDAGNLKPFDFIGTFRLATLPLDY